MSLDHTLRVEEGNVGVAAGNEGDGDSDEEDVGGEVGDEPGLVGGRVRLSGEGQHDVLHDGEDGEAVDGSAEIGTKVEEPDLAAEKVIDSGDAECDEEVECDSEQRGSDASAEGFGAEQSAGDGVRNGVERGSLDLEEDDGEREIEDSGDDAGDEDGFYSPHCELAQLSHYKSFGPVLSSRLGEASASRSWRLR